MKRVFTFIALLSFFVVTPIMAQMFPFLNASTGNINEFPVDKDTNAYMFHGNRLVKMDKNFNVQWAYTYGNIKLSNLLLSKTGAMYFLGSTVNSKTNIIGRINANGTLSWAKDIQNVSVSISGTTTANYSMDAYSLMLDGMNNLLVTGSENTYGPPAKAFLLKTDTNGNILKYKAINSPTGMSALTGLSIVSDSMGYYKFIGCGFFAMGPNKIFAHYIYNDITDVFTQGVVLYNDFPNVSGNWDLIRSGMEKVHLLNIQQTGSSSNSRAVLIKIHEKGKIQWQTVFTNGLGILNQAFKGTVVQNKRKEFVYELNTLNYFPAYSSAVFKLDSNGITSGSGMFMLFNHNNYMNLNNIQSNHPQFISDNKHYFDVMANNYPSNPITIQPFSTTSLSYSCSLFASCAAVTGTLANANQTLSLPVNFAITSYSISNYTQSASSVSFSINPNYCIVKDVNQFSDAEMDLVVFPNPVNQVLYIEHSKPVNKIEIVDLSGRILNVIAGNNSIDVSGLSSGIYFINVSSDNSQYRRKFVKE